MTAQTDEDRWAEAESILARPGTESSVRRRGAWGDRRLVLVAVVFFTALLLLLALAVLLLRDDFQEQAGLPTWRPVVGVGLIGLGFATAAGGLLVQLRAVERARSRASALLVLSPEQRKQLLQQVRGQAPPIPARVPLARHLAEILYARRSALPAQAGLFVMCLGFWAADPTVVRLVLTLLVAVALVRSALRHRQEVGRLRRFIDEHPAVRTSPPDSAA